MAIRPTSLLAPVLVLSSLLLAAPAAALTPRMAPPAARPPAAVLAIVARPVSDGTSGIPPAARVAVPLPTRPPAVPTRSAAAPPPAPSAAAPVPAGAGSPAATAPRITVGAGVYLNVTGAQVKLLGSIALVTGAAGCTAGVHRLPGPAAGVLRSICGLLGLLGVHRVLEAVGQLWRSGPVATGSCYQVRLFPPDQQFRVVPYRGNCVP